MESALVIVWVLICLVIITGAVLAFLVLPYHLVRLSGRLLEFFYKNVSALDDESIDDLPLLPGVRSVMGRSKLSQFIRDTQENPEEFRLHIYWFRIVGIFLLIMLLFTVFLLAIGIRGGVLSF